MSIPIACSLTEVAARDQLGEWRSLLATSVISASRMSPTRLSLRLDDELTELEVIVRLAQREKACCPFFDFTIHIAPEAIELHVTVPKQAVPLLDEFADHSLLTPTDSASITRSGAIDVAQAGC